jgi:hypothetical protein
LFRLFRRKPAPASDDPVLREIGIYETGGRNLVAQGIPEWKVQRAMKLVRKYVSEGVLPEGTVRPPDE